jgi:hypothetical protein
LIGAQRRRSKINEKMKALQSLIPNSNKVSNTITNKALDFTFFAPEFGAAELVFLCLCCKFTA